MDPLSIAASIAGLVQITDMIASKSYKYIKEARGASKEVKKLLEEITDLFGILNSLRLIAARYEDEAFESTMQSQHIHTCHILLETIKARLDKADPGLGDEKKSTLRQKTSTLGRSLVWPFSSTETKALIAEIANHKSTLSLALAADGMTALIQALSQQQAQGDDITEIRDNLRAQRAEQTLSLLSRERRTMLDTVGIYDAARHQDIAIKLRQPGTGVWFTEGPIFTRWLATRKAKTWLYGIPGAGKTVLTSSIIQAATNQADQQTGLAFFYCDYKDPRTHDPLVILGALVRQLAVQDSRCLAELERFYKRHCPEPATTPMFTPEALCSLIKSFSAFFDDVMIIIDALDECGSDRSHVVELLASLNTSEKSNIKTLFTSRLETDIEVHLNDYEKVSIAATSSDLKLYVAAEIENRSRKKALRTRDPDLKKEIMDRLIEGAEGMFRWVACQLDYLCELNTDKALRRALHSLPPTLFATYERILDRVNSSNSDTQELVRRVLTWIVCTRRPLSTKELLEAVSIDEGDTERDEDAMPDEEGILKWCSSLVRRTPDGDRLELAHFTVEEFLRVIDADEPNSQYARYRVSSDDQDLPLAKLCLTYLEFDNFSGEVWNGKADFNKCLETYPLFDYASMFWYRHADRFHDEENLLDLVQILFDPVKTSNFLHWSHYWTWNQTSDDSITRTSNTETLHFAANLSFHSICKWLINGKNRTGDLDKLTNFGTPLYCAIAGSKAFRDDPILIKVGPPPPPPPPPPPLPFGAKRQNVSLADREQTIKYLIDAGAAIDNIKVHPDHDWSPLAAALELDSGWQILLERGAVLDTSCLDIAEDLIDAVNERVADFLLVVNDDNLSDEIRPRYVNVALQNKETRQQAVKMMSKLRDGSKNMMSVNDTSALRRAAMVGQVRVVKELLDQPDIEVDYQDPKACGETALHSACESGHLDIVKLLLDHGATLDIRNNDGLTPFHYAAAEKDVDLVKFLEQRGSDINAVTGDRLTSLHLAANGNSVRILEHLLHSPNNTHYLSEKTRHGRTALLSAVRLGSVETARFILELSGPTDVLEKTVGGHTCLHYAAKSGKPKMMALFRNSGIPHAAQTIKGLTALHYAAQGNNASVLEELLNLIHDATLMTPDPFAHESIFDTSTVLQNIEGEWTLDGYCGRRQLDTITRFGRTALQLLISSDPFTSEHVAMFRDLVSRPGIDLEKRDKENKTPLVALASRLSNTSHPDDAYNIQTPFAILLLKGADINAQDVAGRTALHYLCRSVSFTNIICTTIAQILNVKFSLNEAGPPPPPPSGFRPPIRLGTPPPPPPPLASPLSRDTLAMVERIKDAKIDAKIDIIDKSKETALQAYFRSIHKIYNRTQATDIGLRFLSLASKDHLERQLPEGERFLNLAIIVKNDRLIKELHRLDIGTHDRDSTAAFRSPLELFCIHGARDTEILRGFISSCKDLSELDFEGRSLLHLACANGHTNVVQELLAAGMNVNIESTDRVTAIAEAVAGGHTAIVELLLDHDASVDMGNTGTRGWKSCLLNRVSNVTICRLLVDRGGNNWTERTSCAFETEFLPNFSKNVCGRHYETFVSVTIHKLTPLHHLAFRSRLEIFKYVAEHVENINFNIEAEFGITPLFFAVLMQNHLLVKFLLTNGARTDIPYTPHKWSMLHLAAYLGSTMIVEELLSHGADAYAEDLSGLRPSILALQNQKLQLTKILEDAEKSQSKSRVSKTIEAERKSISPAMTDAIQRGDLSLCQRLVERGFSIDGICECGCTPLLCACANQRFDVAMYLLSIGASVDGITCKKKVVTRGFSAIHYAASFGNEECLKILLEKGALALDNPHSVLPIHLAACNGHAKIVQMLLDHSDDPKRLLDAPACLTPKPVADEATSEARMVLSSKKISGWEYGKTINGGQPLHFAASMNSIEVIAVLLKAGADLEARDDNGITPIHHTIDTHVYTDNFEIIAAAGANLNSRDRQGLTPFLRATRRGQEFFLTKMKSYDKVDIFARDRNGKSALHHALGASQVDEAVLLVEFGLDVNCIDDVGISALQSSLFINDSPFVIDHLPVIDTVRGPIYGSTLTTAAFCGHLDVVEALLERAPLTDLQAYLNLKCCTGTPVYCSVTRGHVNITKKLLDKGADINLVGGRLGSPLIAACFQGRVEIVRELLKRGAGLECVLPDGTMMTAKEAAKQDEQVLSLLEKLEMNGVDSLDELLPRKEADIAKMEETIAELNEKNSDTFDSESSDDGSSSAGSIMLVKKDSERLEILEGEDE